MPRPGNNNELLYYLIGYFLDMGTHYVAQAELKLTIFQESLVVHVITPNYKSQIVVIFYFAICARVFCLNVLSFVYIIICMSYASGGQKRALNFLELEL